MKKLIKFLFAGFLATTLVACAGGGDDTGDDGAANGDGGIDVALLVSHQGDLSFNDSAIRGMEEAEADFDEINYSLIEWGDDPSDLEPTMLDASETAYDIIIGPSDYQGLFEEYASEFPDITYILFDEEVDYDAADVDNVYSIVYSANEASFLGGFMSARISETGVLGFLGGEEGPIINDFLVGYIEGALEADPDIKVATSYVGSWNDSSKGKELSLAMINQEADILFGVAGGSGVGAFEAALEKDIYTLGVDSDQALIYEDQDKLDYAEIIPTSVLKNVDNSLYRAMELYIDDELPVGETETLGLEEGGVGLAQNDYYEELVPEDVREEIEELEEKISSGELEVDSVYGKSTEELNEIKDSVNP